MRHFILFQDTHLLSYQILLSLALVFASHSPIHSLIYTPMTLSAMQGAILGCLAHGHMKGHFWKA